MKITVDINGKPTEITLTPEQVTSIEAQLANTEQLTCDRCKWQNCASHIIDEHCNICSVKYGIRFEPKDTQ